MRRLATERSSDSAAAAFASPPVFRQAESSDQASKLSVFLIFRAFPELRLTLSF